jgi:hypothetical protein
MPFNPKTPQRFSGRAGSTSSGRLRRALDGQVDTGRKINESLDVDSDGRLGTRLARDSGLQMTRQGLRLDPIAVGDKNREPMKFIRDPASTAAADIHATLVELLAELRRSKRMR